MSDTYDASVLDGLSHDQVVEYVSALGKMVNRTDLMWCNLEELHAISTAIQDAQQDAVPTWFEQFLKVLGYVTQVTSPLAQVAGSLTTVFGAVTAAKAL